MNARSSLTIAISGFIIYTLFSINLVIPASFTTINNEIVATNNNIGLALPKFESRNSSSVLAIDDPTRYVVLTFDDGIKGLYENAKPILDRYGFKATFDVVCNFVGRNQSFMNWQEVKNLRNEGHEIGSHGMNHVRLTEMPEEEMVLEIAESKKCLSDQGIDVNLFSYPYNEGSDNRTIIETVSKHYDYGRTGNNPLMFLNCDGWENNIPPQTDCSTYRHGDNKSNDLNSVNRYSILGWSHDYERKANSYNDSQMLDRFIQVVDSQDDYNKRNSSDLPAVINAVPILIYHDISNSQIDYVTSIELFTKEMKYLHDNNFVVCNMADLRFNDSNNNLFISNPC